MNRLKTITVSGTTTSFTYRPDGLRATKTVGSVTTKYLYDGQSLVAEKDGQGTLTASYTNGLNEGIRYSMLDTECSMPDSGYQISDGVWMGARQ